LEHHGLIAAEWGQSENNRRAKFYTLTTAGRRRLRDEPRAGTDWRPRLPLPWARHQRRCDVFKRFRSFFVLLTRRRDFEDGMSEELRFHIEQWTDDLVRSGMSQRKAAG